MPDRDAKLKKALERERELVKELEAIRKTIPHAPHDAKDPLERAVRVVQRILGRVRDRIDHLRRGPKVMFDSITLARIPRDAKAVAGYVDGNWQTYDDLKREFPKAKRLSIAVFSAGNAECADIEPGNMPISAFPSWFHRQKQRGVARPKLYCSLSNAQGYVNYIAAHGIKRSEYDLWTAHYTFKSHICNSGCGFGLQGRADATQWTNSARGAPANTLDESRLNGRFLR